MYIKIIYIKIGGQNITLYRLLYVTDIFLESRDNKNRILKFKLTDSLKDLNLSVIT